MPGMLDRETRLRLERLQREHGLELYASTSNATGEDATGSLAVTLDPTRRVVDVVVHRIDPVLRGPAGLLTALRTAMTTAEGARLVACAHASGLGDRIAAGTPPVHPSAVDTMRRAHRPPRLRVHEPADAARRLEDYRARLASREPSVISRHSSNEFLTISCGTTGYPIELTVDAAWLQGTSPAHLQRAIKEVLI